MLVLISPPPTELDEKQIWLGNQDSQLSETSKEIAKEFARYDMWIKPTRIYTSPALHMRELIHIIMADPDAEVQSLLEFSNRSMGSLTGRTYRETLGEFPRRNWLAWQRSFWIAPPGGESFYDISERVLTAFRAHVLPVQSAEIVLVVVPDDVLRLIIGYVQKTEEEGVPKIKVEPMVPYVINGVVEVPS